MDGTVHIIAVIGIVLATILLAAGRLCSGAGQLFIGLAEYSKARSQQGSSLTPSPAKGPSCDPTCLIAILDLTKADAKDRPLPDQNAGTVSERGVQ